MTSHFAKLYQLLAAGCIFFLYFIFLSHKINLTTADLGRHIKNGEIILASHQIIKTNFYSYTEPNFPVINHHWGAGVVFYLIYKTMGFWGLSSFFVITSLITLLIFFRLAVQNSNLGIATLVSLLILPLLAERTEIRPELFTYFFTGLTWWFLSNKRLIFIPFIELLWVNSHIYFFIGPVLILIYWLKERSKTLLTVLGLTMAATFINPYGWHAVAEPFLIFKNYGYRIIENQPVFLVEKFVYDPNFAVFKVIFGLGVVTMIISLWRRRVNFIDLLMWAGVALAAWFQIRNFTIFGYFSLVVISKSIANIFRGAYIDNHKYSISFILLAITSLIAFISIQTGIFSSFPYWHNFGWGLEDGVLSSAEFFAKNKLSGPIFNDYDIGSYLIFNLYSAERVFVDNRPEAYSASFFKNIYIPMQETEGKWQEEDGHYHFNVIYFSPADATPWSQQFLKSRLSDPEWVPVYFDRYGIILIRNTPANQTVISQFSLPKERFLWH